MDFSFPFVLSALNMEKWAIVVTGGRGCLEAVYGVYGVIVSS